MGRSGEKNTDEERAAMRQCVQEAFWYRSLPAALLTGTTPGGGGQFKRKIG